jgi:hypothetical protein
MSIAGAFASATTSILGDLAKIKAAAGQAQQALNSVGKQAKQTDAELVAWVNRMVSMGIHTTATDSHGNLIDLSGIFEIDPNAHTMAVDANGKLIDQSGIFEIDPNAHTTAVDANGKLIDQSGIFEQGPGYDENTGGEGGGG